MGPEVVATLISKLPYISQTDWHTYLATNWENVLSSKWNLFCEWLKIQKRIAIHKQSHLFMFGELDNSCNTTKIRTKVCYNCLEKGHLGKTCSKPIASKGVKYNRKTKSHHVKPEELSEKIKLVESKTVVEDPECVDNFIEQTGEDIEQLNGDLLVLNHPDGELENSSTEHDKAIQFIRENSILAILES